MSRLVIAGVPKSGKTTLAKDYSCDVMHTDDLIAFGWSEASELVASEWMRKPGPWVIEGVATVRALRKAMMGTVAKPCDAVLYLGAPHVELSAGQQGMAKGIASVWAEVMPRLKARGVKVYESVEEMANG